MEAKILRVELHQKLTSIISVAFSKGAWRQRKDYFKINSAILRKGASKKKKPKSAIQEVIEVCSLLGWCFIISIDTCWDWFQRTYVLITAQKDL